MRANNVEYLKQENLNCLLQIYCPLANCTFHWLELHKFITRRRSSSFAEYCKHFVARLNDVHAFGYNSAESQRIWMKFGELRAYGSELSLTNFGRDPRRSGFGRASPNFFCPLNNARFHRLPVGQISRNLHEKTCFRDVCWGFEKHLWKFVRMGSFFPKKPPFWLDRSQRFPTSRIDFSETITNLGKLWQVGPPVECWLSTDTVGMNSEWFPWPARAHGEQFFSQKYSLRCP